MRIDDVREAVTSLENRMAAFEGRMDQRFISIDNRFVGIDARLDRITNQLFGLMVGVTVAAIGGVLGVVTSLIRP